MINNGLFSTLFLDDLKQRVALDDMAKGRMATLGHAWKNRKADDSTALWNSFMKQALGYLSFVPANQPVSPGMYPLYEDYSFTDRLSMLYLLEPGSDLDDTTVGRFWPAKLIVELKQRKLNWGILTDGATWRLYSLKSSRPFEDYVELPLAEALAVADEGEYGLFERFFHIDSFVWNDECGKMNDECEKKNDECGVMNDECGEAERRAGVYTCRLDEDREASENVLEERVKKPLLAQVDEALQYLCNGFIFDTQKSGEEYSEEERREIFESAVKLLYRCLFLFYAEARRLLPSEVAKSEAYRTELSMHALCDQAHRFKWGQRDDHLDFDLWQHLKGLVGAVNDGDTEYGIMGYNGGLFDDTKEKFLGTQRLRNDFLARALYLLAYVEPLNNDSDDEYEIPYQDLEVRHLGELYENILEFSVSLCDADRLRRRTKKGVQILLASENKRQEHDKLIRKGEVYFGESALERKQTGSYYTPESLVRFLNEKAIIAPLLERFDVDYRPRFEQFLESIDKGMQQSDVKGAARSAVAQVQRFVDEVVLAFRVCDPAMGSGHFLVDAANQMAGLVVELLAEIPDVQGMDVEVDSSPNSWRRRITRYCLYGVDLNSLAVNLAKLSLWLNCFAMNHKLTFLDHHLRCGNSLIGIRTLEQLKRVPKRKKDGKKKQEDDWFDLDDMSLTLEKAAEQFARITEIDEDDTDRQKAEYEEAHASAAEELAPLADLFTAYLMDSNMDRSIYERVFRNFSGRKYLDPLSEEEIQEVWNTVEAYRDRHHYFHWALEFPDVMGGDQPGFNATVGNPPWDIVKPNSQEFFSAYDPAFRSYKKQKANKVSTQLMEKNPVIHEKWDAYCNEIAEQSAYVREEAAYAAVGNGDVNTYKLFLEQFFTVLRVRGHMGIVTPSGLYTDQGCLPLRKLFFDKSQIKFLYCFENRWPAVFPAVDGRFKFICFCTEKGGKTEAFKCAFMQHDPERLPAIDAGALSMKMAQVKKFSPDSLSVMEFSSPQDIYITSTIYDKHALLGSGSAFPWKVEFGLEIHKTNSSYLLKSEPTEMPLYEGKMIHQFDHCFNEPHFWLDRDAVEERLGKRAWEAKKYRLGYREIAASTNERTLLPTVLPRAYHGHKLPAALPYDEEKAPRGIKPRDSLWLAALMSSFVIDFCLRKKVTTSISMFYVYSLPIVAPKLTDSVSLVRALSARLICTTTDMGDLWTESFSPTWESPSYWYPSAGNMDYGPAHEREIRERLAESAESLTNDWTPACGVHDRLPDRRDTGDRAQLRAEIDAYVAHLYGLSRDDFAYILDTFPVLKRKEMKAFGEFMSKRKCLEEYDRLEPIVKGAK